MDQISIDAFWLKLGFTLRSVNDLYSAVLREVEALGTAFAGAGFDLYLVGGIVRDLHLGVPLDDLDFDLTTNARPEQIKALVSPLATALWTQGEKFGTIGAEIDGRPFEITTHRAEAYSQDSRKPEVVFGDDLEVDLSRRDFTLNAMALRLPAGELVDPFNGLDALEKRVLITPIEAEVSFSDDPLRILRASRFIARYDLHVDPSIITAGTQLIDRMSVVSVERIREEFDKLLLAPSPSAGFKFLVDVDAWPYVVAEVDPSAVGVIATELDAAPLDLVLRRALVFRHVPVTKRQALLSSLRYSNVERRELLKLLEGAEKIHAKSGSVDAALVRRLVHSIGYQNIERLRQLLLIQGAGDRGFGALFEELDEQEDLTSLSPVLTGEEVMSALDLEPGPRVGEAIALLQERRFDDGPLDRDSELEYLRDNFSRS